MNTKLAYSLCICIYAKIYVNLFWRLRILNKLVLIDGNSLSFRAFYALPLLSNHAGIHTNAVYGFAMLLEKIIKEEKPNHFLVAFDAGKTTFRHSKYSEYKGGRQKTPPELSEQFPYIRQLLDAYHIKRYELDNYEADDIIGTLSRQADEEDFETIIITGDRDLTQLATDNVTIYYTKKGVTDVDHYTPKFIAEKYNGLVPKQIIDMKGLMGDTSDNIPGVAGVGEKTAIKLLNQFESVEGVYEHIEEVTAKKLKEKLINSKDDALMSKDLATINVHSPVEVSLEDTKLTLQDDTAEKKCLCLIMSVDQRCRVVCFVFYFFVIPYILYNIDTNTQTYRTQQYTLSPVLFHFTFIKLYHGPARVMRRMGMYRKHSNKHVPSR